MSHWTEDADIHTMLIAGGAVVLRVTLTYGKGVKGYKVVVNNRSIKPLFATLDQGKQAAVLFAKKVLREALDELDILVHPDEHPQQAE